MVPRECPSHRIRIGHNVQYINILYNGMGNRMMKLSVIIPAYNAGWKLSRLLHSFKLPDDTEVIVIDDASTDDTIQHARIFPWVKILRQSKNKGVAAARNRGARIARGNILLFLDADVECFDNTLFEVIRTYEQNQKLSACSGIIALPDKTTPFFPRYKGIRTYVYWMIENRGGLHNQPFGNACGSVRARIFLKQGGFDEKFSGASLEDAEFGARLVRAGLAVGFNQKIRIKHRFEDFLPMVKKYIHRSRVWTKMFLTQKSFESVGMTRRESINGAIGSLILPFVVLAVISTVLGYQTVATGLNVLCVSFLAVHLWLARRFYQFVWKEAGLFFMTETIGLQLLLYTVIYCVAATAGIEVLLEKIGMQETSKRW